MAVSQEESPPLPRKRQPFRAEGGEDVNICDRRGLESKLAQVRGDDYSLLISEMVDGLAGLSVPLRERDGRVMAALGVSMVLGSRTEKQIITQCLPALRETARTVEALLHAMRK